MKRSVAWLITLVFIVGSVSSQALWDSASKQYRKNIRNAALDNEKVLIPEADALRALSLGNNALAADLLWVRLIQYFGTASAFATYQAIPGYVQRVTDLDPKFAYAYEFGLLVLPFMNKAEEAEQLGLKSEKYINNDGMISFYMASNYHINLKNYKKAAEYYDRASKQEGAPEASKQLAAIAYSQTREDINDRLIAINFWETVIANAKNEAEKARSEAWLEHMQIVYALEIQAAAFKQKVGRYPTDLQELVTAKYIKAVPPSPIYRKLILDSDTGRISFTTLDQEAYRKSLDAQ